MTSPPDVKRFAELAASPCPTGSELLISLAAEFDAIDPAAVEAQLDEAARELFGIARSPAIAQAQRLASVLDAELALEPVADDPAALLIHRVLESACPAGARLLLARARLLHPHRPLPALPGARDAHPRAARRAAAPRPPGGTGRAARARLVTRRRGRGEPLVIRRRDRGEPW